MFRLFPHGGVVYVFSSHRNQEAKELQWMGTPKFKVYIISKYIYIPGTGTYIQRNDLPRSIWFLGSVSPFKNVEFNCSKEMFHPSRGYHPICCMTTGFQRYIYNDQKRKIKAKQTTCKRGSADTGVHTYMQYI